MRGLYLDTRIGNCPRWRVCDERELMQVPPELLKCVCFVERRSASEREFTGTAFFVSRPLDGVLPSVTTEPFIVYVATAAHVLKDQFGDPWDGIRLCLNTNAGGFDFIETPFEAWTIHDASDTAVLSLTPNQSYFDYMHYPVDSHVGTEFFQKHQLTPGEDVLVTGLLWAHPGFPRIAPIARVGHVAGFPLDPINLDTGPEGGVLIEVLSLGGLSGSPAFLHLGDFRREDWGRGELLALQGPTGPTGGNWLLGIVQGRFEREDKDPHRPWPSEPTNVGITAVIPAARIIEILNSDPFEQERLERVKKANEGAPKTRRAARTSKEPEAESEYARFEQLTRELVHTPKADKQKDSER